MVSNEYLLIIWISGRDFGVSTIESHIKECTKKWDEDQAIKPAHERLKMPTPPKNFMEHL